LTVKAFNFFLRRQYGSAR